MRFDPQDPAASPILAMMEKADFGNLRAVMAQALRAGAAAELGVAPLEPPPPARKRAFLSRRFVPAPRDESAVTRRMDIFTAYDPREPWNAHLETIVSRCEWGDTNATMVRLLIAGLQTMGYTERGTAAAPAAKPASPVASSSDPAPAYASTVAPAQTKRPASSVVGVDPTQAMPRAPGAGVNSLIRGVGRRSDQG